MKCFRDKVVCFFAILLTHGENVESKISRTNLQSENENIIRNYEREMNFTNLVFQPDINSPPLPPETPTVDLNTRNGYPLEIHQAITDDGFILHMFRIPCGRIMICNNSSNMNAKPPVILLPPVGFTADSWLQSLRVENTLPFFLADFGYDVWLPNLRGSSYSNKNIFYDPSQKEYWNFSLDEFGKYDVRAIMEFILEKTGKPKLHFISHSGSSYSFFAALAKYTYLNEKIALGVALAPAMFQENMPAQNVGAALVVDFFQLFHAAGGPIRSDGITKMISNLVKNICSPNLNSLGFCRFLLFAAGGHSNFSKEQLAPMVKAEMYLPSLKVLIHILQIANTREFREYDYGAIGNLRVYGQPQSPKYDLMKVTAPVALIQAPFDALITTESMERLARSLPNVVDNYVVPINDFSHFDFCCGEHNTLVFSHTVKLLNRFS